MRNSFPVMALVLGGTVFAIPALAERGPSKEESKAISARLAAEGFKSWNRIEYNPDRKIWKVDDARAISGKTYDVKLNSNYEIVKKDGD